MRHTLTITEELKAALTAAIFSALGREGAAYLVCGVSTTTGEVRLLGREVIPVKDEHYLVREADRLSVASESYASVAKRARLHKEAVLFVHSHPEHYPGFSPQDDREDPKLLAFLASRAPDMPHGCLVFNTPETCRGRIWVNGEWAPLMRTRVIGRRFRFLDVTDREADAIPEFFDRQVRAFGPDVQRLLRRLHVGVVGAGGTGSAVIEQLTRLGVGTVSVFDRDTFEGTNVTRVYGSGMSQDGMPKVEIQNEHVTRIGVGTKLLPYPTHITDEETAKRLLECDFVFGCTDKHAPRGILVRLVLRYLIPCIDIGVKIDSKDGIIRGIWGRVTTLLPGEACLFCRGTIDSKTIREESLPPEQREQEIEDGYAAEIADAEPAVVMFTTAVAAQAVSELLHRLTGFMGEERVSTETLLFFHETQMRRNRQPAGAECICQQRQHWGRGDSRNFLGLVWSAATKTAATDAGGAMVDQPSV